MPRRASCPARGEGKQAGRLPHVEADGTMSHDAFLQSIIETPDDDAPRLVYADWLEDNGDPVRAEFIRLQCRHPDTDEADPAWHEASGRISLLEEVYGKNWQPEIPVEVRHALCYRRGFVSILERSCESFLANPAEFDHLGPIEGLCCTDIEDHDDEEAFAALPYLARLRWLTVTAGPFGVMSLARSPHLSRLEEL